MMGIVSSWEVWVLEKGDGGCQTESKEHRMKSVTIFPRNYVSHILVLEYSYTETVTKLPITFTLSYWVVLLYTTLNKQGLIPAF